LAKYLDPTVKHPAGLTRADYFKCLHLDIVHYSAW
jgi:hypothetical protein